MKRKILITGMYDGALGVPLATAAADWGIDLVPVTIGLNRYLASEQSRELKPALNIEFLDDGRPISEEDVIADVLRERVTDDTLLVDVATYTNPALYVERFGSLGLPIVLLSPFGYPSSSDRERMDQAVARYEQQGPVSILLAPGYTVQGEALLEGLGSIPDYKLNGEVEVHIGESIRPTNGRSGSGLAQEIRAAVKRVTQKQVVIESVSIQDLPFEYLDYHHRLVLNVRRRGGDEQYRFETRGSDVYVEDFYRTLLPWFTKSLEANHVEGRSGLGVAVPYRW